MADREAEDPEWWLCNPEEIEKRDHVTNALRGSCWWRMDEDVRS